MGERESSRTRPAFSGGCVVMTKGNSRLMRGFVGLSPHSSRAALLRNVFEAMITGRTEQKPALFRSTLGRALDVPPLLSPLGSHSVTQFGWQTGRKGGAADSEGRRPHSGLGQTSG